MSPTNHIAKRLFDQAADAAQAGRCVAALDSFAAGHEARAITTSPAGAAGERARWNILRHCVIVDRQLAGARRHRSRRRRS